MRTLITLLFILGLGNTHSTIALSPQALEEKLVKLAQKREKYAQEYGRGGSKYRAEQYEQIEKELESLADNLLSTLRHNGNSQDVLSYDFPKLKEYLNIATSEDKKLRIYTIDIGGGTMRFYSKLVQYQVKTGKVYIMPYKEDEIEYEEGPTGDTNFCHNIFQIDSKDGPIYLAVSTFVNSTKSSGQQIRVLRIQDDQLDLDARLIKTETGLEKSIVFYYDFFSVVDHPERPVKLVFVDEKARSFQIPIIKFTQEYDDGEVTDDFLTYKFDGKYFVQLPGTVKKDLSEKK
jgi:hypothetical protein